MVARGGASGGEEEVMAVAVVAVALALLWLCLTAACRYDCSMWCEWR